MLCFPNICIYTYYFKQDKPLNLRDPDKKSLLENKR